MPGCMCKRQLQYLPFKGEKHQNPKNGGEVREDSRFANATAGTKRQGLQNGFAVIFEFRIVDYEVSFRDEESRVREMEGRAIGC